MIEFHIQKQKRFKAMVVEHSFKDEPEHSRRCPCCGHVSTLRVEDGATHYGYFIGLSGDYFICQNPKCNVERIYGDNAVEVGGEFE